MALHRVVAVALCLTLAGCGGTKLVKNAPPPPSDQALARAGDERLAASLEWVIVRNGAGTWARNADWDEYLIDVNNTSGEPMLITSVSVTDSRGHTAAPLDTRRKLVKASKKTVRSYRDAGIVVKAGSGGGTLIAAGTGATALGMGIAVSQAYGSALGAGAAAGGGAATATASALLLGGPVLVGWGVVRAVQNAKVGNRIESRSTALPLEVAADAGVHLDLFFPISPAPQRVAIEYRAADGIHRLDLDTGAALAALHLPAVDNADAPVATSTP